MIIAKLMQIVGGIADDAPEQETDPDFTLVDDMILSPEQYDIMYSNITRRVGFSQAVRLWPNATVPYLLDNNFSKVLWWITSF